MEWETGEGGRKELPKMKRKLLRIVLGVTGALFCVALRLPKAQG